MEHLVEIIKAIAWPASIIWLGYIFRNEVRQLLGRVSSFKYKDVEANFEKDLSEAENSAKTLETTNTERSEETLSQQDQLLRIAEVSPRAAIVEAWTLIETAAIRSGLVHGTAMKRTSPKMILEVLSNSGKLSSESILLIENLRRIRNRATHMPDFAITQSEAERYLGLAVQSSSIIESTRS